MAFIEPFELDKTSAQLLRARQDTPWELHIQKEWNFTISTWVNYLPHYTGKKSNTQNAY